MTTPSSARAVVEAIESVLDVKILPDGSGYRRISAILAAFEARVRADEREALRGLLQEIQDEITYWHSDYLTNHARRHPRGSGWARISDQIAAALRQRGTP